MSSGFSCPHLIDGQCVKLQKLCDPGDKGCVLYGKVVFSNPNSPSNKAVEKREEVKNGKKN